MGRLEMELGLKQRSFLIHHCEILRRIWSLELLDLQRLMGLKMEDNFRIRQDRTLMDRYLEYLLVP